MHPELPTVKVGQLLLSWPPEYQEEGIDEFQWQEEMLCEDLTSAMEACDTDYWDWVCWVTNFGWQSGDAFMPSFDCDNGKDLLQRILPKTECSFKIYTADIGGIKSLAINNFHHDAPTGKEWYYVMPDVYEHTYCAKCSTDIAYRPDKSDEPIICPKCNARGKVFFCESCDINTVWFELEEENVWQCPECGLQFNKEHLEGAK